MPIERCCRDGGDLLFARSFVCLLTSLPVTLIKPVLCWLVQMCFWNGCACDALRDFQGRVVVSKYLQEAWDETRQSWYREMKFDQMR